MWISIFAVISGFLLLIWGAERFVSGATGIASKFGVSPLIIGLTVVAFGTSAPEMFVAAFAAIQGNPSMGVGNAIGSNITNVTLVVGVTALLIPLQVHSQVIRREIPVLLVTMVVVFGLLWDEDFSRIDGVMLLAGMVVMMAWVVRLGRKSQADDPLTAEYSTELPENSPASKSSMWFGIGLVSLLVSSYVLVWGAVNIAQAFGVSDLVIGLTIVAIGTSLPELAASIAGVLKNEHDMAIGNIIGSNMFNLLGVMAMPGLIAPHTLAPGVLTRDYPVMFVVTLALLVMAYGFRGPGKVTRVEGGVLLASYAGYLYWLYLSEVA